MIHHAHLVFISSNGRQVHVQRFAKCADPVGTGTTPASGVYQHNTFMWVVMMGEHFFLLLGLLTFDVGLPLITCFYYAYGFFIGNTHAFYL